MDGSFVRTRRTGLENLIHSVCMSGEKVSNEEKYLRSRVSQRLESGVRLVVCGGRLSGSGHVATRSSALCLRMQRAIARRRLRLPPCDNDRLLVQRGRYLDDGGLVRIDHALGDDHLLRRRGSPLVLLLAERHRHGNFVGCSRHSWASVCVGR